MNILFLDTASSPGHKVFNRIQLSALLENGYEVTGIFRTGYGRTFKDLPVSCGISFPSWLYPFFVHGKFLHALFTIFRLWWAAWRMRGKPFDAVVLSLYTPVPILFMPRWKRVFAMTHAGNMLDGQFAQWCIWQRSEVTVVVFEAASERHFRKLALPRVAVVPHGRLPAWKASGGAVDVLPPEVRRRRWIFSPSNNITVDKAQVQARLLDAAFLDFLRRTGLSLVVRGDYECPAGSDVVWVCRQRLSDEEYRAVFSGSLGIWLPYSPSFRFRTSGVLFECMAAGKPCVMSDIPAFREYAPFMAYPAFYQTPGELCAHWGSILSQSPGMKNWWKNLDALRPAPAWRRVLEETEGKGQMA